MYYHLIIHFAVLLVIGGLFCLGLFMSSRGESEQAPNGTCIDKWGMIFYPITKFACKTKTEIVYYSGYELKVFFSQLIKDFPNYWDSLFCDMKTNVGSLETNNLKEWLMIVGQVENKYGVKISTDNEGIIKIWKEYEKPVYNSFFCKPLIGCYKCYASIWGSLIFWLGTNFAISVGYFERDYSVLIPLWIVYCLSLVSVNCMVYKLVKD